jgi:hypothetical protein
LPGIGFETAISTLATISAKTVDKQIQLLQELLGETPAALAELQALDITALSAKLAELQQRPRARQGSSGSSRLTAYSPAIPIPSRFLFPVDAAKESVASALKILLSNRHL